MPGVEFGLNLKSSNRKTGSAGPGGIRKSRQDRQSLFFIFVHTVLPDTQTPVLHQELLCLFAPLRIFKSSAQHQLDAV